VKIFILDSHFELYVYNHGELESDQQLAKSPKVTRLAKGGNVDEEKKTQTK
jgi:hypothetical protein